ncbi:DUF4350 domain-containing protein, partial [Actinotalea sp. JY-7885]|uniref:DUF4350 domain-containing protein n=1 Tax=Actinotalea sp. JY-7885 TaxID=2758576 RepID=UPI00165D5091
MTSTPPAPATPAPPAGAVPAADLTGTSAAVLTTGPEVMGDGTTTGSRARSRWRAARGPLICIGLLVVAGLVTALLRPETSITPLAPDNASEQGARALAQVLEDQGVRIQYVRTSGQAAAAAREGTTLLVAGTYLLSNDQVEDLTATDADLVVVGPEGWHVGPLTDGAVDDSYEASPGTRSAECSDPDAAAAGSIDATGYGFTAESGGATVCFPGPDTKKSGAYASVEVDGRRVVLVDDPELMTNRSILDEGHAALMLRALGHHEDLVWYVPSLNDTGGEAEAPAGSLLPDWTGPVGLLAGFLVVVLALWRGRRLGPVVTEPLPVTVRAAETTLGRGRLYRRGRSRGHAAASLRAGMARR